MFLKSNSKKKNINVEVLVLIKIESITRLTCECSMDAHVFIWSCLAKFTEECLIKYYNLSLALKIFYTVTPDVVSTGKRIQDADIARIAGDLPHWQTVASNLGMGQLDIEDIENINRAPADQRKSFLIKWIWKNGNAATYEKLSEVLERLGEQGAAEKIRGIAQGK